MRWRSILFLWARAFFASPRHKKKKPHEEGFALILTLLIVLLLTVLIFDIDHQARSDLRAAWNFRDDTAAYFIALSGVDVAKQALQEDAKTPETKNMDWPGELWATPVTQYPVQEGTVSGSVTDEAGKININALAPSSSLGQGVVEWRANQLGRLFQRLEVNPELVDAIIDWIDTDNDTRNYGAENDFYPYQDPPYSASNKPMATLQELLFVKGMTREAYKKIVPYLTIYGDGKLNLNTATPIVLQSLGDFIHEETVQRIEAGRPYANTQSVSTLSNFFSALSSQRVIPESLVTFRSDVFSIDITATVRDTKKVVRVVWNRANDKLLHFQIE